MSTAAAKNLTFAPGRSAGEVDPRLSGARKARTPLSVVRSVPKKRRAPFVVLCFGMLAVALIAVLVLNISVSTAQYQLVKLRSDQTALTKQNQDLTQQVQNFQAPQNLAAKASELGMVASSGKGQIDLSTLTVSGSAKPAANEDSAGAVIAAPAVPGQLNIVPPASTNEPLESRKPVAEEAATPVAAPAAAAKPAPVLNGGTIPAPAQKVPGQ
jgi:cell division protein FtsL